MQAWRGIQHETQPLPRELLGFTTLNPTYELQYKTVVVSNRLERN